MSNTNNLERCHGLVSLPLIDKTSNCFQYVQADVGLGRSEDRCIFLNDNPRPVALDPIDENNSLRVGSPVKGGSGAPTPRYKTSQPGLQDHNAEGMGRKSNSSSHVELPHFSPDNWTRGELIGQGAFGSVYLGMNNETGQLMAVKTVTLTHAGGASSTKLSEHLKSLEAEVSVLQGLDHPNIVRYLGIQRASEALNIFLEYVPGGSIASLLAKFGSFRESVVKVYTKQILLGLEYLHAHGIIHRDIKGANILVDNTGLVKLADFGASKKIEDVATIGSGYTSVKGTPYWMAPEVITQAGHGRQADIWSVACTVIEMATGKPPWSQYGSQVSAMFHIAKSKGPPLIPEHLSPDCKDFLYLCFNRNWRERPSASKLLKHPFLEGVSCRTSAAPLNNIAAPEAQAIMVEINADSNNGSMAVDSNALHNVGNVQVIRQSMGSSKIAEQSPTKSSTYNPHKSPSVTSENYHRVGNPRMSPLAQHYARNSPHKSLASSVHKSIKQQDSNLSNPGRQGARRHLDLDGVSEADSKKVAPVGIGSHGSPNKRSAVRASAPTINDSKNLVLQRKDSTVQDSNTNGESAGQRNLPSGKQLLDGEEEERMRNLKKSAAEVIEATLMLPSDSKTSYSTPMQQHDYARMKSLINCSQPDMFTRNGSTGRDCMSAAVDGIDTVPQTIAIPSNNQANAKSTSTLRTSNSANESKSCTDNSNSLNSSSRVSERSEFNPMEEPAWAGPNSLDALDSQIDIRRDNPIHYKSKTADNGTQSNKNDGESKLHLSLNQSKELERLTSQHNDDSKSVRESQKLQRQSSLKNAISLDRFSKFSYGSIGSEKSLKNGENRAGLSNMSENFNSQRSSLTTGAGTGPIVYTVEGDNNIESLPWDVDISDPERVSVSSRGGISLSNGSSMQNRNATSINDSVGGADEELLIGALMQRARQDLKMSLPVFSHATSRKDLIPSLSVSNCERESNKSSTDKGRNGVRQKSTFLSSSSENACSEKPSSNQSTSYSSSSKMTIERKGSASSKSDGSSNQDEATSPLRNKSFVASSIPRAPLTGTPSKPIYLKSLSPSKLPTRVPNSAPLATPSKNRMMSSSAGSYEAKFKAQLEAAKTPGRGLYATPRKTPRKLGENHRSASLERGTVWTPSRRHSTPARA